MGTKVQKMVYTSKFQKHKSQFHCYESSKSSKFGYSNHRIIKIHKSKYSSFEMPLKHIKASTLRGVAARTGFEWIDYMNGPKIMAFEGISSGIYAFSHASNSSFFSQNKDYVAVNLSVNIIHKVDDKYSFRNLVPLIRIHESDFSLQKGRNAPLFGIPICEPKFKERL